MQYQLRYSHTAIHRIVDITLHSDVDDLKNSEVGMEIMRSKLRLYSLGIVLETKKRSSWIVKVYPVEEIPLRNGPLNTDTKVKATIESIENRTVEYEIIESNAVYARWLPLINSNRATPPDVCVNETILLFKYEDTDEFFWTSMGYEPQLRKQETVTYVYSNVKDFEESVNSKNSYWMSVSTHDKYLKIHTSANDGEYTTYDVGIDTKQGTIYIRDGVGNHITFKSDGTLVANMLLKITLIAPEIVLDGNVTMTNNATVGNNLSVGSTGVIPTVVCNTCTCCD